MDKMLGKPHISSEKSHNVGSDLDTDSKEISNDNDINYSYEKSIVFELT